jgi:hypothetical protein
MMIIIIIIIINAIMDVEVQILKNMWSHWFFSNTRWLEFRRQTFSNFSSSVLTIFCLFIFLTDQF